jgi:gluconokinase
VSKNPKALTIAIVMGVSGSGKTTIGKKLASALNWQFCDADSFHPPANVEKMSQGIALNDEDRMPWLLALQNAIAQWLQEDRKTVLACSALKSTYREILGGDRPQIRLVYLKGSFQLIQTRLKQRQDHFMHLSLLQNQFDTLEEPDDAIIVEISQDSDAIVKQIIHHLFP